MHAEADKTLRLRDTLFYRILKLRERKNFALLLLVCLEAHLEETQEGEFMA